MDKTKKRSRTLGSVTWPERQEMIELYLTGQYSKAEIWRKYNLAEEERGNILKWMRRLGYDTSKLTQQRQNIPNFKTSMKNKSKIKRIEGESPQELRRRIKQLEKELEMAQVEREAFRLTIELAEKELKLPIRKKSEPK